MSAATYNRTTGRRKCAIAQAKLSSGSGEVTVNGKPYQQAFTLTDHRRMIEQPFIVTDTLGKYNVEIKVVGGGITGQAGAIRLAIARGLVSVNESFKGALRQHGLLTRDPRIKERKKYGLKRARKAPQYTKR
ncbi:MAG: 30S ribosomal protein S9 [Dehalococcoidia bacterium]|jgi:small subunit ribosomal protein S9|nr:30S ribosomal protein S9 [Dehalococcoidia bacterium]MDD5494205.1 30S ribosomal protein S9 [Dehalococcoidia bacterium]